MRTAYRRYTPEEDALVSACEWGGTAALAERLGRTPLAVSARKALLRNGPATQPAHRLVRKKRPPISTAGVFARPDFFEEDLGAMARTRR